jgi:hypothetical protein
MQRRDALQAPGIFDHYRDTLAERSIVNLAADVSLAAPALEVTQATLNAPLNEQVLSALRSAAPSASSSGITVAANDVWTGSGSSAVVTVAVPNAGDRTTHLRTYGEIRDGDRIVATLSEPFTTAEAIEAAPGTKTSVLRLDLPPGEYGASFAVFDDRSGEKLTAVSMPLRVFDPAGDFALSSVLISSEPTRGEHDLFTIGDISLHPRSDAHFSERETIWYFATIRAKSGPNAITADVQLRRDGKPVAAYAITPKLNPIAPGIFLFGQELPLAQFGAGRYTLYVTVRQAERSDVRRADFVVVP